MRSLKTLREGWDEMRRVEETLSAPVTAAVGVAQLDELWRQFAPLLELTEVTYRAERMAYLTALQARLRRLPDGQYR